MVGWLSKRNSRLIKHSTLWGAVGPKAVADREVSKMQLFQKALESNIRKWKCLCSAWTLLDTTATCWREAQVWAAEDKKESIVIFLFLRLRWSSGPDRGCLVLLIQGPDPAWVRNVPKGPKQFTLEEKEHHVHHGPTQEEWADQIIPFPHTQHGDKIKLNHATYRKYCKTLSWSGLCSGTACLFPCKTQKWWRQQQNYRSTGNNS